MNKTVTTLQDVSHRVIHIKGCTLNCHDTMCGTLDGAGNGGYLDLHGCTERDISEVTCTYCLAAVADVYDVIKTLENFKYAKEMNN